MKNLIVVVSNKSWYEGYIPFYIYFALRACPDAYIACYFMGELENSTYRLLENLEVDKNKYKIFENYNNSYGKYPITSKLARWTIMDDFIKSFDNVYIGDIDLLLAKEDVSLFDQHINHCNQLGIPISNMVRKNENRLTGLHFFNQKEYFNKCSINIEILDNKIKKSILNDNVEETFGGSDEIFLYQLVLDSKPEWIDLLKKSTFRPHHGTHLGLFRKKQLNIYKSLLRKSKEKSLSNNEMFYFKDTYNVLINYNLMNVSKDYLDENLILKSVFQNFCNIAENL